MNDIPNTIYVDLDGTLCPIKRDGESYDDLPAREDVVARLGYAREEGLRVVVFTSRSMRTYKGDLSAITRYTGPSILRWLERRNVPFDGLLLGKPWPGPKGFYVDDRTLRPDEFVRLDAVAIDRLLGRVD